ncbi:hypothetical protein GCM10007147_29760 [Nocardiopsis kunsanensis]|uniref:Probable transposase IS891/IS1136/IS1341 domain-containing protein n=1 Tax=Nocardiopsis kunsanensis TaxID=141693 RepID=A0A918XFM2_9ACTN|nr:hypothetical protein GCM10007147_29760 [Nocardiopsis kunsanensis]
MVETDDEPLPDTTPEVGIDLGLSHFAVLSNGTEVASPRFLRRAGKKLKKAQRALSRTQKGSHNKEKARLKVARAHVRVADARKTSTTSSPHGSRARTKPSTWKTCR